MNTTANSGDYIRGMDAASKIMRQRLEDQDTPYYRQLGARLGYTYLMREDRSKMLPLSTFALPPHPFTIIWPFVIVRELVLNNAGETMYRHGKTRIKHKIRLLPR